MPSRSSTTVSRLMVEELVENGGRMFNLGVLSLESLSFPSTFVDIFV